MKKDQAQDEDINPIFRRDSFVDSDNKYLVSRKDYDKLVKRPAILATRLLDSQQALHFFYTTFYGKNTKVPRAKIGKGAQTTDDDIPEWCSSDKGVNDLSGLDNEATRYQLLQLSERLWWRFEDLDVCSHAVIDSHPLHHGPCGSMISIDTIDFEKLKDRDRSHEDNACLGLHLAVTMLHEVAHAANNFVMGARTEDYFEDSNVAEAGFELESCIFGMCPYIDLDNPSESVWSSWQSWQLNLDMDSICRNTLKLKKTDLRHSSDPDFALKLLSDDFWNGEYSYRGGVALIPPSVVDRLRMGKKTQA